MKVYLASYQPISLLHGGPRVQVLQTKAELVRLGVNVELFDPWKHFVREKETLFHLFAANLGTFHTASVLKNFDIPFATSPIFFTRHSPTVVRATVEISKLLRRFRSAFWTNYEFTRQICAWSKAVLPNTTDEAKLIAEGLGIHRSAIHIIPNGVEARFEFGDPSLFKKKYGIENFILNVGHIGPERKNVLNLIRALKRIDHPAVIIGKISSTPMGMKCVEEARQSKNILIIDGLDNDSAMLASAYAACDVFALPSLFETPGIAALEAAVAGAKIVITPFGGTKDYFLSMAEYVDPYSIESIADGIQRALNRKKDSALKEHIKREFLWSRVAEKTLAVYRQIIS